MVYRLWMGLRQERGQGTVEYVGLILLIAGLIAGVVAYGGGVDGGEIGGAVLDKLKSSIEGIKGK
jgi:F0F1-type ATP synthase membrane subunit c/vacuolar-type H+-ATPase subunit K